MIDTFDSHLCHIFDTDSFFIAKVPSPTTTPSTEEDQNKVENWPEQTQRQPMKPLMDPQVVQEFLLGKATYIRKDGF